MTTFETLKERWEQHRITETVLRLYVKKGIIIKEEFKEITGKDY